MYNIYELFNKLNKFMSLQNIYLILIYLLITIKIQS